MTVYREMSDFLGLPVAHDRVAALVPRAGSMLKDKLMDLYTRVREGNDFDGLRRPT